MESKAKQLRNIWDERENQNIKYSKRPTKDLEEKGLISDEERIKNIKERFHDLSSILKVFYDLYKKKSDLYGDAMLAFIGDKVLRHWHGKIFPLLLNVHLQ